MSFSEPSYGVMENGRSVTIVIFLSQISLVPFEVEVTTMNMTATGS